MKRILPFVLIWVVLFFVGTFAAAQELTKPTCIYSDWADRFTADQEYNSLLEKACDEIKTSRFRSGLEYLNAAIARDSVAAGTGEPNAFLDRQRRKIEQFLSEHPGEDFSSNEPVGNTPKQTAVSTTEIISTGSTSQPETSEPASATEPAPETAKAVVEPVAQNREPVVEPVAEPVKEVASEPVAEPVKEVASEPVAEPVKEVVSEPVAEPVKEVVSEPVAEPVKETVLEPIAEPAIEPVVETVKEPVTESTPEVIPSEPVLEPETVTDQTETKEAFNEPVFIPEPESVSFSETEMEEFRNKGMQKIKQLEEYLILIGSRSTALTQSSQAIENAIKLFDKETRTVEISSAKNQVKLKRKIREYLNKLRMLQYDDVAIEWADLQYASDFKKGPDGNYYAYVVFSQRFSGLKDNQIAYQDVTTKRTEIILKAYDKYIEGEMTQNWDVFLGDISVIQTEGF